MGVMVESHLASADQSSDHASEGELDLDIDEAEQRALATKLVTVPELNRKPLKCEMLPLSALRSGRSSSNYRDSSQSKGGSVLANLSEQRRDSVSNTAESAVLSSHPSRGSDSEPLSQFRWRQRRRSSLSAASDISVASVTSGSSVALGSWSFPPRPLRTSDILRDKIFLENKFDSADELHDIYEFEDSQPLGEGGFGSVRAVRLKDVRTPSSRWESKRDSISLTDDEDLSSIQDGWERATGIHTTPAPTSNETPVVQEVESDIWSIIQNWFLTVGCCCSRSSDEMQTTAREGKSPRSASCGPEPTPSVDSPSSARLPAKGSPSAQGRPATVEINLFLNEEFLPQSHVWKSNRPWDRAVKTIPRWKVQDESLVRTEIAILRSLDHPCICRLFETFEDKQNFYMVLERINGRDLLEDISATGHMSEHRAACITQQIFKALQYCHEKHVVHRDIKPENIMVMMNGKKREEQDPFIKLIDFGLAIFSETPARGKCRYPGSSLGTGFFLAPEAKQGVATAAGDIWSAGVVLYILLAGVMPEQQVLDGDAPLDFSTDSEPLDVSEAAKDLLVDLVCIDPSTRLTAASAAVHPWILENNEFKLRRAQLPKMIKSFVSYHQSSGLRKALLTGVAKQMTDRHICALREQFMLWDRDGDGRISKEEMKAMLVAQVGSLEMLDGWDHVFDSIDTDGSGQIEYTEWLAACCQQQLALRSDQAMRVAFRMFDANGDGVICKSELARVLNGASGLAHDDIKKSWAKIDNNGDGVIDYEEFRAFLLNVDS